MPYITRRSWAALFAVCLCAATVLSVVGPRVAYALTSATSSNVFTLPVPKTDKWRGSSCGDVVVWDEASGLWGYDLSEKRLFQIPTPAGSTRPSRPEIVGDWIAFGYRADGDSHIAGYNRATDTLFPITSGEGSQGNYEISGDTIVWVSPDESDDSDIFGMDLSTGETFTVTAAPGLQGMPDIAGEWVVYSSQSAADGNSDVMAYNIRTKVTTTLCGWSGDQQNANISDTGFVVWQNVSDPSRPDETTDLYGRYVTGGEIRKIAGGKGSQASPTIGGNLIVYSDSALPSGYGLLGYDLLNGQRFGISKAHGSDYYIAGIQDGTIARLYTPDAHPRVTTVQIVWPTELDVISDGGASDESVDMADQGLLPDPPLEAAWISRIASAQAASGVSTVVVSYASSWTNAVVACGLAGRRSPLLFTGTSTVSESVLAKLAELAPRHVVVVGGPTSATDDVMAQMQSVVGTEAVTRFAGINAETRSLEAAAILAGRPGWDGTVLVTSSASAASGLTAAPVSVWKGLPVILADSNGLSTRQIAALTASGAQRFVVVGTRVPALTVTRLKRAVGASRVSLVVGTSVASTSAKFATWATAKYGMSWDGLCIASSTDRSHSLTAALTQGRMGSVLLMSGATDLSGSVKDALIAHDKAIRKVTFAGNRYIVSKTVRRQVRVAIR